MQYIGDLGNNKKKRQPFIFLQAEVLYKIIDYGPQIFKHTLFPFDSEHFNRHYGTVLSLR